MAQGWLYESVTSGVLKDLHKGCQHCFHAKNVTSAVLDSYSFQLRSRYWHPCLSVQASRGSVAVCLDFPLTWGAVRTDEQMMLFCSTRTCWQLVTLLTVAVSCVRFMLSCWHFQGGRWQQEAASQPAVWISALCEETVRNKAYLKFVSRCHYAEKALGLRFIWK